MKHLGFADKKVDWVQCDKCELWYHLVCIGLTMERVSDDREFICGKCRPIYETPSDCRAFHHMSAGSNGFIGNDTLIARDFVAAKNSCGAMSFQSLQSYPPFADRLTGSQL